MIAQRIALIAVVLCPALAGAQVAPNPISGQPDFTIVVEGTFDPDTVAEFTRRANDYVALRARLEKGLPPLRVTEDADEIEDFERRLARRIDDARGSRRGQIFLPIMEGQVKRMLLLRADPATTAAIMDDGPVEFDIDINETYSKKRPLATMPPNLLLRLPDLPPDLEYRFVGRHLILRDARANIIVDEIRYALKCDDYCVLKDHDDDHDVVLEPNENVK